MKSIELPSRIDRLEIMLAPDRVSIVFPGKGLRPVPQLLAEFSGPPSTGEQLWQSAMNALAQWLQGKPAASRARVSIRLSSRFVRYAILPWSEDLAGRKEEQMLAHIVYEGIYGDAVNGWNIAIASARYGEPCLMAATDQALLTALDELFPGKRLQAVCPMLSASFSACHDKLPAGDVQLAIVEAGAVVFVGCQNKRIRSVKRLLIETDEMVELPVLLQREALLNGYDLSSVSLCYSIQDDKMTAIKKPDSTLIELPSANIVAALRGKLMDGVDLEWQSGRKSENRLGMLLLIFSVAVLVGVIGRQAAMLENAETLQTQIDEQNARQVQAPVAPEVDAVRKKIEAVNTRLTFPWDRLLRTLESSVGEDVALLAVEPDTVSHQVKIEAEARDWAAMIDYVGKLDGEGAFAKASLVSHQVDKSDPQMPIRFVVLCELKVNSMVGK